MIIAGDLAALMSHIARLARALRYRSPQLNRSVAIPPPSRIGNARRKPHGRADAANITCMEDRRLDLLRYTEDASVLTFESCLSNSCLIFPMPPTAPHGLMRAAGEQEIVGKQARNASVARGALANHALSGHMTPARRALPAPRRRGREAEGDGLLNRYRGNPIVGSNPTVSASNIRSGRTHDSLHSRFGGAKVGNA